MKQLCLQIYPFLSKVEWDNFEQKIQFNFSEGSQLIQVLLRVSKVQDYDKETLIG